MAAGRPFITLDENVIRELASKGRTLKEIAAYLGVSESTIYRNYANVVKQGRTLMEGSLRAKQFELAEQGNPTMLIWLGKQYLGQSDKSEIESTVRHDHADFRELSDDQLDQVEAIVNSAQDPTGEPLE